MIELNSEIRSVLAPTGRLRAAINLANSVLAQQHATTGAVTGITPRIAADLAARLGVPLDMTLFHSTSKVVDALASGSLDLGFLAREAERAAQIDFSEPYLLIECGYLAPIGSPITDPLAADRAGITIAVSQGGAYDLYLTRTLENATLVRAPSFDASVDLLREGTVDLTAGVRPMLEAALSDLPGCHLLPGHFMHVEQAIGIPKRRTAGLAYVDDFIKDMRSHVKQKVATA